MPFIQGESGSPNGRPVGSQNKAKKKLREMIENFLVESFEEGQKEFDELQGKDKVKFYCELLPYGLAKIKSESDTTFERLTDEEIDELFEKLKDVATRTIEEKRAQARISQRPAEG
ncbi:MAG TPA: hypothetical protein VK783_11440 [Bacteroidia bacterium]|nr:hypothetical protein [Bacteroidia bacterium]